MIRQWTATVYILHEQKVLLIQHPKFKMWLPPGGHIEENETAAEAALREVKEETGLEVEIIDQGPIHIDRWNAKSMPRPYLVLLQEIPAFGSQPAHQHMDQMFLGRPLDPSVEACSPEGHELRWFTLEQIQSLRGDIDIFVETQEVLGHLLNEAVCCYG